MRFRAKIGVAICAAITTWSGLVHASSGTIRLSAGTGILTVNPTTQPPTAPAPVASPVFITGIPIAGGPVSHPSGATDTDTHEGVTWRDSLTTDLLDVGDAKVGLKYYGATTGSGVTHGVGFSITIPE